MDAETAGVLKAKSALLDEGLKQFLPARASSEFSEINEYYEMLWDYLLRGGKRIRPALCMLSCAMFGGDEKKTLPTAVALELLHCFFLVHDDIEDGSDLRRGRPTLHKLYGIPAAVNAGDGLFAKTWETLAANRRIVGATKAFRLLDEFSHICAHTVEGQAFEMAWVRNARWDLEEKDYYRLVELKTAHYTTTASMRMGAIIAGAPSRDVNAINKFGLLFGTAFQIQDDVLNLAGSEARVGKEVGGDIYEGKRTLALLHLFKKSSNAEKERLLEIMNKPREEKAREEVDWVLEKMREKGSIDYAAQKARQFAIQARDYFEKKFSHIQQNEGKKAIGAFVDFVVSRQS